MGQANGIRPDDATLGVLLFVGSVFILSLGDALASGVLALWHPGPLIAPSHASLLGRWAPMGTQERGLVAMRAKS